MKTIDLRINCILLWVALGRQEKHSTRPHFHQGLRLPDSVPNSLNQHSRFVAAWAALVEQLRFESGISRQNSTCGAELRLLVLCGSVLGSTGNLTPPE